jgi:hypothetical protein
MFFVPFGFFHLFTILFVVLKEPSALAVESGNYALSFSRFHITCSLNVVFAVKILEERVDNTPLEFSFPLPPEIITNSYDLYPTVNVRLPGLNRVSARTLLLAKD